MVQPLGIFFFVKPGDGLSIVLSGVAADSHSWNLVYLQLWLEERGHVVRNLGPSVLDDDVLAACQEAPADLLVVSSVNGHGWWDGIRLIRTVRAATALPAVIGGKLGINGPLAARQRDELREAGYTAVFEEPAPLSGFDAFLAGISPARPATGLAVAGR